MGSTRIPSRLFLKTAVSNVRKGTGFFLAGWEHRAPPPALIGISQPVYPTELLIVASQQSIVSARLDLRYEALVRWLNRS
jgi:hypothetical protein